MNKILFKLIEGKGKFFLMRDVPSVGIFLHSFHNGLDKYKVAMNENISEALKNGEIVNPKVIHIDWGLTKAGSGHLNNGQIFDFPEGMGFETFFPNGLMDGKSAIRLLPEKPVQEEESQQELFRMVIELFNKEHLRYGRPDYQKLKERFTIKRKD